jgi:RNA polymerase sigma-70 factor, ECF subfamily
MAPREEQVGVVGSNSEIELADLVKRIIGGDAFAEEELVHRYKEGVSIIIGRIVQSRSATEDLSQETFLKALEKIRHGEVRQPDRLSGFICAIARNIAIEYVRRGRRLINQEEIGKAEEISDPAPSQLDQLCRQERCEVVRQVLSELKVKRDRDVLFRYYIAEEDKDQICRDLGLTTGQFSRIIFRALNRYKELYTKLVGAP